MSALNAAEVLRNKLGMTNEEVIDQIFTELVEARRECFKLKDENKMLQAALREIVDDSDPQFHREVARIALENTIRQ